MGQSIRKSPARERKYGGYDIVCAVDPSMDLHLRLLAEVAGDAIYDAASCQIVAKQTRAQIAKLKSEYKLR